MSTAAFYVRELVEQHRIRVPFVSTVNNLADFFTKPLPAKTFRYFRDRIMNVPSGDAGSSPRGTLKVGGRTSVGSEGSPRLVCAMRLSSLRLCCIHSRLSFQTPTQCILTRFIAHADFNRWTIPALSTP